VFALIERSQFARNAPIYARGGEPGALPVPGFDARTGERASLLEFFLRQTEALHGGLRRYTAPDESPFFPAALADPLLALPPAAFPGDEALWPGHKGINLNGEVMRLYVEELVPGVAPPGDCGNYGSATLLDIAALQALSKRIHYGKFVAEAKWRADEARYAELAARGDAAGILEALTDETVERKVVARVTNKAAVFGGEVREVMGTLTVAEKGGGGGGGGGGDGAAVKVPPELIGELYARWVMPLTKEVQVAYLLQRGGAGGGGGAG